MIRLRARPSSVDKPVSAQQSDLAQGKDGADEAIIVCAKRLQG